jgi:hypothetical protein
MTVKFSLRGREHAVTVPDGAENVVIEVTPSESDSEKKKSPIIVVSR